METVDMGESRRNYSVPLTFSLENENTEKSGEMTQQRSMPAFAR